MKIDSLENFSAISIITNPEKLLMGIYREAVAEPYSDGVIKGWRFYVEKINDLDKNEPLWDTWEENFASILEYPKIYSNFPVVWHSTNDGEFIEMSEIAEFIASL